MKTCKITSLILAIVLVCALCIPAFAEEKATTTTFTYHGAGKEQYTVTVPAALAPGGSGSVTLDGTWASNRAVTVEADKTVTLINSISQADEKKLDVTFAGITQVGSNTEELSAEEEISVENISEALFGTWSGVINYQISIADYSDEKASEQTSEQTSGDSSGKQTPVLDAVENPLVNQHPALGADVPAGAAGEEPKPTPENPEPKPEYPYQTF